MGTARMLFEMLQRDPQRGLSPAEREELSAELFPEASFALPRSKADVLALTSRTSAPLRPFVSELFRSQTRFNHLVVDVLEDAVWTASRPGHALAVERRLGGLVGLRIDPPLARRGPLGSVLRAVKRGGAGGAALASAAAFEALRTSNRSLLEALKRLTEVDAWKRARSDGAALRRERLPFPTLLGAQATFVEVVAGLVEARGAALTGFFEGAPPLASGGAQAVSTVSAGKMIVRIPAGEQLVPGALEQIAGAGESGAQLVYGDTWRDDLGYRVRRPGWSPDYLAEQNYIGGCFAVRGDVVKARGLSAGSPVDEWLVGPGFQFGAVVRIPQALSRRSGPEPLEPRAPRPPVVPTKTLVTIVIPFKDRPDLLEQLLPSITGHEAGVAYEVLLVSNRSEQAETFRFLAGLRDPRFQWFEWNEPFNWSAINNAAAARARGDLLLFLNNDTQVLHDGWLATLAGRALNPEVGVVGARLLYPDRSIQHAGVVVGLRGLAGHPFVRWRPEYGGTPFGSPEATRNWSAVTGACLMIRKALFDRLGGFDPRLRVSGGDVELCLRVREQALRVVCAGDVSLIHHESVSRQADPVPEQDVWREFAAYRRLLEEGDPFWHPDLCSESGSAAPRTTSLDPRAHAVRAVMPWLAAR